MEYAQIFKLRPHHSLCIQFFIGKGYSDEFVIGMTETIEMLNLKNPLLDLSEKCDIICRFCPNNIDGICTAENKVHAIDSRCLDEIGLSFGDNIRWSELKSAAAGKIIKNGRLQNVCQTCQWSDICNNFCC